MVLITGIVKFFLKEKGYGFIIEDNFKLEYFFHISHVIGDVEKGDTVEFQIESTKKGLQAQKVKKL